MYDTHVTVVGNVLHEPEWRRTANTGALVTTFKIASTARRMNRETGQWVDGNTLRVRVTCWRALASNVKHSVTSGDPVVVHGRLFTRDWRDSEGVLRTQYELEATAVGHDLSRGRAVFERVRPRTSTSAVEDTQAQERVGGEPTELVPDAEAPSRFNDVPYEVAARAAEVGVEDVPAETSGRASALPGPDPVDESSVDGDPVDAGPGGPATGAAGGDPAGAGSTLSPAASDRAEPPVGTDPAPPDPLDPDPAEDPLAPAAVEPAPEGRGQRRQRRARVPA